MEEYEIKRIFNGRAVVVDYGYGCPDSPCCFKCPFPDSCHYPGNNATYAKNGARMRDICRDCDGEACFQWARVK